MAAAAVSTPDVTPSRGGAVTPSPLGRAGRPISSSRSASAIGNRSTSPSGRRLAANLRRHASMVNMRLGGDSSASALEQSTTLDYPGLPVEAFSASTQMVTLHHLSIFGEKVNNQFADAQRKRDSERRASDRRFQLLEQKVDSICDERSRDDLRKKWADMQGTLTGVLEELQNLGRRTDSVEKNLWTRTSGFDAVKQRSQELEQQVQNLEQHSRLAESSKEEVRKREASKLRRVERCVEELSKRFSMAEANLLAQPREYAGASQISLRHQAQEAEDVRQRVDWLEEQLRGEFRSRMECLEEAHEAPKPQRGGNHDDSLMQDAICDLTEQLSCLDQRTSCSDRTLATLQQQVQELIAAEQGDYGRESALPRTIASLQAELGAMSQQVSDVTARLIDLEGNLEFGAGASSRSPDGLPTAARGGAAWQSQLDEIRCELSKVGQWFVALQQQRRLGHPDSDAVSAEASPQRGRRGRGECLVPELEDLSQRVSCELRANQDVDRGRVDNVNMLNERLSKLEENTELYICYTKCVATDQCSEMQRLDMRLADVESSHKEVQQLLHETEDAAPSGPRSIAQQLEDVREQAEAAQESVLAMSAQMLIIEGRSSQQSMPPSGTMSDTIASFCKDFKLQSDDLQVMDQDDLQSLEAALQNMQGSCLHAADQITESVKCELRELRALSGHGGHGAGHCAQDRHFKKDPLSGSDTPPSPVGDEQWSSASGSGPEIEAKRQAANRQGHKSNQQPYSPASSASSDERLLQ